ncbi:MAG: EAL domain-containing protein [Gammaproteobacteria bacterium]|nr:EAL domain-containing protein [Gammaproteobacteria bacterium]
MSIQPNTRRITNLVLALAVVLLGVGAWLAIGIQSTLAALGGLPAGSSAQSEPFAETHGRLLWQTAGATLALLALLGLFAWLLTERAARRVSAIRRELRATTITRDYLDQILSGMNEALVVVERDSRIVRVNPAACQMAGRSEAELLNQPLSILLGQERADELLGNGHDTRPRDAKLLRSDGEHVPVSLTCSTVDVPEAEISGHVIVAQDVSERQRADQRIRYLARIDSLTKVPNRMQFQHLLQRGIARARRRGRYLALMYIDVDRFKDINDTYGHLAGDISLEQFSERLLGCLPDSATVGRLAGDEFAVVLDAFESLDEMMAALEQQATTVLEALNQPLDVLGHEIYLTASIGVARYPIDAGDVIDLIRNADAALYVAKKTGGNNFAIYSPEMNDKAVERLMLKSKLRRALENDELTLRYQPKYSLATGKVVGAEALVRWDMPERGMIPPGDFVPLAEETNLILELGNWVLHRVCEDYRRWQRTLASPGRVSVNLSLKQLRQRHFLRQVGDVFRTHGVSPTCLELEITETTLMEDTERTIKLLNELYGMGLHLAIDDFGTGYSSLSALQQFPISTLKIDRSFVQYAATDRDDATIVSTIIQMGHNLGIEVVAEGVETQAQLEFLRAERCDYAQGMLFGEPFEADEYAALLLRQLEGTDVHRTLFA